MKIRRALSILFAFILITTALLPSVGAANSCDCGNYPVVMVNGMGVYPYVCDAGLPTEHQVFPPAVDLSLAEMIAGVVPGVAAGYMDYNWSVFESVGIPAIYDYLHEFSCNPDGTSTYNVTTKAFYDSIDNYPEDMGGLSNEGAVVTAAFERLPADHVYEYNYDWRISPLVNAEKLRTMIELAKEQSGHDKVNIICASMGGVQTLGYIYKYGTEDIDSITFLSSTFTGTYIISDLFTKRMDITYDKLVNYLAGITGNETLEEVLEALKSFGARGITSNIVEPHQTEELDAIYDEIIIPVFGYMGGVWALCQDAEYEEAKEIMLAGADDSFIELIDEFHYNVLNKVDDILYEANEGGTRIHVFSHYNFGAIPVYERADEHADTILETACTGGHATVAKYGETLGDASYKALGTVCADPSHNHVSPDRVVDASTCMFPEYTWFAKDVEHVEVRRGSAYEDLLFKLVFSEEQLDVHTFPEYPQFLGRDFNAPLDSLHKYGDINGDKVVGLEDVRLALCAAAGVYEPGYYSRCAAHTDGSDGKIYTENALEILKYTIGIAG